jgi:hypothetical protein
LAISVEICHFGPYDLTIDGLGDGLDRAPATGGGDRELLLGSFAGALHLEVDSLQGKGSMEALSGPARAG